MLTNIFQHNLHPQSAILPISTMALHPNIDLHIHRMPTQNPINEKTIVATMNKMIVLWFSNASLISKRAIFLIFLCRCQLFFLFPASFPSLVLSFPFASPVPSRTPCFGPIAS